MHELNKYDIEFLIKCLTNGEEIPLEYKYAIFPTKQKEYELVYAGKGRKEDILADNEEAKAVPLQIEKIFNSAKDPFSLSKWSNLLVFGDNLQILKTFCKNEDPLIKDKIKGKVKLIYIDPPFATEADFKTGKGVKAYSDKAKGADFIEFLRRRLIVARELLADDGCIYVHLDWKKSHYIKLLLDEIFGESNFKNEIIWHYTGNSVPTKCFPRKHDVIFLYSKSENLQFDFKDVLIPYADLTLKRYNHVDKNGRPYKVSALRNGVQEVIYAKKGKYPDDVWDIPIVRSNDEITGYPTQKPEILLEKIIRVNTKPGDLVLDFFCGSGTTLATAEKLGRRWIGCDIGKLAIYTSQKRLLEISKSKDLETTSRKYAKDSKSFAVVTSGLYDLSNVFKLKKDEYVEFVKRLFEVERSNVKSIGGVSLDGKRREFYVKIFPYWDVKDAGVDEAYIQELHKNLGDKIDGRLYIIVPANNVYFISDYYEINGTRYYFLKVPYQIIKELHRVQFKKLRQPQSKKQVNDLDDAIGFHFVRQPEVKSEISILKNKIILKIKRFESAYEQDESGEKLKNFESLAMILVDLNNRRDHFLMTDYFFAEDLIGCSDGGAHDDSHIRKQLEKQKEVLLTFDRKLCGEQMMVIYVDIYGNEFREVFNLK